MLQALSDNGLHYLFSVDYVASFSRPLVYAYISDYGIITQNFLRTDKPPPEIYYYQTALTLVAFCSNTLSPFQAIAIQELSAQSLSLQNGATIKDARMYSKLEEKLGKTVGLA